MSRPRADLLQHHAPSQAPARSAAARPRSSAGRCCCTERVEIDVGRHALGNCASDGAPSSENASADRLHQRHDEQQHQEGDGRRDQQIGIQGRLLVIGSRLDEQRWQSARAFRPDAAERFTRPGRRRRSWLVRRPARRLGVGHQLGHRRALGLRARLRRARCCSTMRWNVSM